MFVPYAEWRYVVDTLDRIEKRLIAIKGEEDTIMADLTQLTADVTANGNAVQSAITLLQGLKAALDAAGTDPTKLAALSTQLEASTTALANAVVANTPAAT
jgi:hypothetical protein